MKIELKKWFPIIYSIIYRDKLIVRPYGRYKQAVYYRGFKVGYRYVKKGNMSISWPRMELAGYTKK